MIFFAALACRLGRPCFLLGDIPFDCRAAIIASIIVGNRFVRVSLVAMFGQELAGGYNGVLRTPGVNHAVAVSVLAFGHPSLGQKLHLPDGSFTGADLLFRVAARDLADLEKGGVLAAAHDLPGPAVSQEFSRPSFLTVGGIQDLPMDAGIILG